MKKIIIFGFPHCGTTILRSIISHIDDVYEINPEVCHIDESTIDCKNKKYILCKWPYLLDTAKIDTKYKDYIKIFIIRNPIYVFSSLNKRMNYIFDKNHSIEKYISTIKQFIEYKNNNKYDNLYLIRYEDMFENNFEKLKEMFNKIGFIYNNDIFNNEKYKNIVQYGEDLEIPKQKPLITEKPHNNKKHTEYRSYQINQPFINNNDVKNIDLLDEQLHEFTRNIFIQQIYPNILDECLYTK